MLEGFAGDVAAGLADVGDDDADVGDRHLGHFLDFDRREARVDEIAAGQEHLLLQALETAGVDECLRRPGTSCGRPPSSPAISPAGRAGPSLVVTMPTMLSVISSTGSATHGEQRRVDAVGARRNHRDLRAALAAVLEERSRILEGIALDLAREHAAVGKRTVRRAPRRPRSVPSLIVTNFCRVTEYCQGQSQKCRPGASVSACRPASPSRAMISPSGSVRFCPTNTNFLLTMPIESSGMMTTPKIRRTSSRPRTSARITMTHQYLASARPGP